MTIIEIKYRQKQQQKYQQSENQAKVLEFEAAFHGLAHDNSKDTKLSVVCSALTEASSSTITPEDIFIAALATLEGKLLSEEADEDWTTQLALMKVLNLSILSITDGTLYHQNFNVLSRVLRAMNLTLTTATANNNKQQQRDGFSTTVRHLITVSKTSIGTAISILHHPKTTLLDKPILKLLQDCILYYFDHSSPKIRKAAHLCAMELLAASTDKAPAGVVKQHICQYVHAVLTTPIDHSTLISSSDSPQLMRLFHMLHFVRQASGLLLLGQMSNTVSTATSFSVHIDQDLIQLFVNLMNVAIDSSTPAATTTMKNSNTIKAKVIHLVSCIFHCLLAIMEYDPTTTEEQHPSHATHTAALRCTQKEISSQVLASLLQKAQLILSLLKISDIAFSTNTKEDNNQSTISSATNSCRVVFTQLIVTSMCVLIYNINNTEMDEEDDPQEENQKYHVVAQKLYPLALQTVVHCCTIGSSGRHDENGTVYRCSLELQRMNQVCLSSDIIPSSSSVLLPCVETMKLLLNFKNRSQWNHLLQSYSHFIVQIVLFLNNSNSNTVEKKQYADVVSSMIDRIVETHLAKHSNDPGAIPDIENAVGIIIEGIGIEQFLLFCSPLDKSGTTAAVAGNTNITNTAGGTRGLRPARLWILNLLKSRGAKFHSDQPTYHLAFFQSYILALARKCDAAAANSPSSEINHHQLVQKQACIDLWSLLVFFCANPVDIQESLPTFVPTMLRAIQDVRYHPHLIFIICSSIKALAIGAAQRLDDADRSVQQSTSHATTPVNQALLQGDVKVISDMSVKILPALFKMVENLAATSVSKEASASLEENSKISSVEQQEKMWCTNSLTEAIAELARLAPPDFLQTLFKKVMHRLILAIQQQEQDSKDTSKSSGVEAYLYLSQALVSSKSLDGHSSIDILYRSIKPLIRTDEQCVKTQKSA